MALGANARVNQPDPILTNLMQDNSKQGGWLAPILCAVKPVAKDYVRWAQQDAKTLLTHFAKTLRAPGDRANLIPRPIKAWLTSVVQEDAVRVEYTEEDVRNSVSPEEPRMNSAMKILNVLQYAIESRVAQLFDPSTFASAQKTAATAAWAGSSTSIMKDVMKADLAVLKATGLPTNYIRIPVGKWAGIIDSDEIKKNYSGFFNPLLSSAIAGGFPTEFMGKKLLIGVPRVDTTLTGTLTPAFVWDDAAINLSDTVHVGYSPTLDGGAWSGDGNTFVGQFENEEGGAAFQAQEYLSPYYQEDETHIVFGSVRRSLPEVMNAASVFAITSI